MSEMGRKRSLGPDRKPNLGVRGRKRTIRTSAKGGKRSSAPWPSRLIETPSNNIFCMESPAMEGQPTPELRCDIRQMTNRPPPVPAKCPEPREIIVRFRRSKARSQQAG
jgi:hypothetical protein